MEPQTALALTEEYDPLFIREKLNQLRKELRRNARSIQNPAGWLVSAIRKDFTAVQRRLPMPELYLDEVSIPMDGNRSEMDRIWKKVKDILEIQLTRAFGRRLVLKRESPDFKSGEGQLRGFFAVNSLPKRSHALP